MTVNEEWYIIPRELEAEEIIPQNPKTPIQNILLN